MAQVYAVVDTVNGRKVALKRPALQGTPEHQRRVGDFFAREFHALCQLAHPRIVEVYDYGVDEDGPYYTMEILDGGDLQQLAPLNQSSTFVADGFLREKRYLIMDRDPVFTTAFSSLLMSSEIKSVRLPARSPNLNAYAESVRGWSMKRFESSAARISERSSSGMRRCDGGRVAAGTRADARKCRSGVAAAIHRDLRVALSDQLDEPSCVVSSILGSAIPRISCAFL